MEKLRNDPSEFVRRAAAHFVTRWQLGRNTSDEVLDAMRNAVVDSDREVQRVAVAFWKLFACDLINDGVHCVDDTRLEQSVRLLLCASCDCDVLVRIDALKAISAVKYTVKTNVTCHSDTSLECCVNEIERPCVLTDETIQCMPSIERHSSKTIDGSSNDIGSVLLSVDWNQRTDLEIMSLGDCCRDRSHALLDDVIDSLAHTCCDNGGIVVDCY